MRSRQAGNGAARTGGPEGSRILPGRGSNRLDFFPFYGAAQLLEILRRAVQADLTPLTGTQPGAREADNALAGAQLLERRSRPADVGGGRAIGRPKEPPEISSHLVSRDRVVRTGVERIAADLLDQPLPLGNKSVDQLYILARPLRIRRVMRRAGDQLRPIIPGSFPRLFPSSALSSQPLRRLTIGRVHAVDSSLAMDDLDVKFPLHLLPR